MNKFFNHKLFEIFFEKALIALILLLAGHLTNQSLERYKLIEIQRAEGTTAFVNACQEIWSKIFEYETTVEDITSARSGRLFLKNIGEKNLKSKDIEIEKKSKLVEQQLTELKKLINDRKFIIGHNLSIHFWRYVGFINARADAENSAFNNGSHSADVRLYDEQIASMRFTSNTAREYAISQLPQ